MSIYKKLNDARADFHARELKKSGHNKFAGYKYFELGDFLTPGLDSMNKAGLCVIVSFSADFATMRIVEIDGDGVIEITSPMGSASLKGCHEVQNIGAAETYQRRYLWIAALEIVEHDAIDSSEPVLPTYPAEQFEKNLPKWQAAIEGGRKTADEIIAMVESRGALSDEQKDEIRQFTV